MENFLILKRILAIAALAFLFSLGSVHSSEKVETFFINKQEFKFALPSGYCKLGDSAREREFKANVDRHTNGVTTTQFLAADCDALLDFLRSRTQNFSNFLAIQTVQQNGKPVTVKESRKEFIKANVDYLRKQGLADITIDLNGLSSEDGLKLKEAETRLIGEDSSAFYMMTRFKVSSDSDSIGMLAVQGSTLVKSHVVSVNVFQLETSNGPKKRLLDASKQVVKSLIENSKQ